jgi:PAS domain S-box-containing protein
VAKEDKTRMPDASLPNVKMSDDISDLHRRAQEKLKKKHKDKIPPVDVQNVVHELEVHQIELEMQNEELRLTQQELSASREKYFDLYDLAPVGYVSLNEKGIIVEANLTAAVLFGEERSRLLRQPLIRFIDKEDWQAYHICHKELLQTHAKQVCELRITRKDDNPSCVRVDISTTQGPDGTTGFRAVIIDISEGKRLDDALKQSEKRYHSLFENMLEGCAHCKMLYNDHGHPIDFVFLDVNNEFGRLTGLDNVVDKNVTEVIPGIRESHPELFEIYNRVALTGQTEKFEIYFKPLATWLSVSVYSKEENYFVAVLDNITERKKAEDALRKAHDNLELGVQERTAELMSANQQLLREIAERKKAEESLLEALQEVKQLQSKLHEENIYLKKEINLTYSHKNIVGNSESIRTVLNQIEQVALTDSTVLIQGETGTGKELIALAIHDMSSRKDRLMIKVNCAALPPPLIESELFGREKGAFTGALSKQIGRFELADASTIFLDEIDALPLDLQAKLLRVIESGEFERLGSPRTVKVDVRIISATNRDLAKVVNEGGFRKDLYYRLNVFQINAPSLRERRGDILPLIWSFVQEFSKRMGKLIESIPQKDIEAMQAYPWPGNVRELRNVTERAMIIATGPLLHLDVPKSAKACAEQCGTLEEVEKRCIIEALNTTGWRISGKDGAAEILGINPKTLESRLQKLGIPRNKKNA